MTRPNFAITPADAETLDVIVRRILYSQRLAHEAREPLAWYMDLTAAHNACPLDLDRLATAPELDFWHDVYGIARHIDRETGQLGDCFLPRYARLDR
jgi:hypothetical protein